MQLKWFVLVGKVRSAWSMMNAHGAAAVCDFFFDPYNSQLIIDLNVLIDESAYFAGGVPSHPPPCSWLLWQKQFQELSNIFATSMPEEMCKHLKWFI